MADDIDPSKTLVGMELDATAVQFELRVNDLPVADPIEGQKIDMRAITSFPMNPSFQQGRNVVTIKVRPNVNPDVEGFDPALRMRFSHWKGGSRPSAFDERPYAIDVAFAPPPEDANSSLSLVLTRQEAPGQPLIKVIEGAPVVADAGDGWVSFSFILEIEVALPKMAWLEGQQLEANKDTAAAVAAELRAAHGALAQGEAAVFETLDPYLSRLAASFGVDVPRFVQGMAPFLTDPAQGYTLDPFTTDQSQIMLFGEGRLAALVPFPVTLSNAEYGDTLFLYLYYWKDSEGRWQVVH